MTDPSYLPLPGTIGLVPIHGEVGRLIRLGQFLAETPLGRWMRQNNQPPYEHAFVYIGNGQVIEAEPGGARIVSVNEYAGVEIYWCNGIAGRFTEAELAGVAELAASFKGVKYSFLDYFALAAHRLHIPAPGLRAYIKSTKHEICSALCDAMYQAKGLQIFADGRWQGYVMPMDLYLADRAAALGNALRGHIS